MILLREAQKKDVDSLFELANIPGFLNLPQDRDLLTQKIKTSSDSFSRVASSHSAAPSGAASGVPGGVPPSVPTGVPGGVDDKSKNKFLFVAEDLTTGKVLGTSMLAGQHGTKEAPHLYFEVGTEKKYSETINTGFIHGTLRLKFDSDGPSEIGALVVDPEIRNSDLRVGRQISFVRFMYLGLHRGRFKRKILAELLPPLNKRGQSPLWEAIGRRFTNMDYWEADQLCAKNKEFVSSLFPTGKIYTTFFTGEARNAIGKVGDKTLPVFHMLTKIGFKYKNQVDPFDGGPHLWAAVDELLPVQKMRKYTLSTSTSASHASENGMLENGLISPVNVEAGTFRAVATQVMIVPGAHTLIFADSAQGDQVSATLGLKVGDAVHFMPYY